MVIKPSVYPMHFNYEFLNKTSKNNTSRVYHCESSKIIL